MKRITLTFSTDSPLEIQPERGNTITLLFGGGESGEGLPGDSAYQVAVNNGFIGTQLQWLESLRGAPGLSAYDLAKEGGYTGTQEQFELLLAGMNTVLTASDVVNDLHTEDTEKPLSASMGKRLNDLMGTVGSILDKING